MASVEILTSSVGHLHVLKVYDARPTKGQLNSNWVLALIFASDAVAAVETQLEIYNANDVKTYF
jgi:hypothetical protein